MLKITCEGVYYKNGGFVPAKDGPAAGLPAPEKAREGTMAHAILKAHNTGDNMEELAIRLACERITPEELEELDKVEQRFLSLTENGDLTELAEMDVAFHDIIYKATNNKRLVQLLSNLREQMYRYRIEYLKDIAVRRTLAQEHRAICEALRKKDKESALKYVYVHVDNQQKAIIRSLNEQE